MHAGSELTSKNNGANAAALTSALRSPIFTSLPNEVHSRILHFLTLRSSLLAFACVSRNFLTLAISALWRNFSLNPVEDLGEYPNLRTDGTARVMNESDFARGRTAIGKMMASTERERWDRIRAVRGRGSAESAEVLVVILRMVYQRLKSLHIVGYRFDKLPTLATLRIPTENPLIDILLSRSTISFPELTHLTLGSSSYCLYEFIPFLLTRAPNLLDLDVSLDTCETRPSYGQQANFTPFVGPTRLCSLRIVSDDPHIGVVSDDPQIDAMVIIAKIVKASPELRRLIWRFCPTDHDAFVECHESTWETPLVGALDQHTQLRDLYWPLDSTFYDHSIHDSASVFQNVERMITKCDWVDTFEWQYKLPKLQQLFLDCSRQPGMVPVHSPPLFSPHILLQFCDFADTLRNYPLLHIIHTLPKFTGKDDFALFDQLEVWGTNPSGRVGSMRHGSGELICVRLLSEFEEVEDQEWVNMTEVELDEGLAKSDKGFRAYDAGVVEGHEISLYELDDLKSEGPDGFPLGQPYITSGTTTRIRYSTRGDKMRERVYERNPPAWRLLSDYDGLPVPEEVVQAMRRAEGLKEEVWERRGVWVGAAAWTILADWHADELLGTENEAFNIEDEPETESETEYTNSSAGRAHKYWSRDGWSSDSSC